MKKICFFIAVVIFWYAYSPFSAFATITMVVDTKIIADNDGFEIDMKVSNTGDEDSLVVYPELRLGSVKKELKQVPYIAFEGSSKWNCKFKFSELGLIDKGGYPLFITIHYHDANMYPFSSPHLKLVQYGDVQKTPKVEIQMDVPDVKKTGIVHISIRNPLRYAISGNLKVFSAKELPALEPTRPFFIDKEDRVEIVFNLENQNALPGSIYRVYAVMQFNHKGYHVTHTSFASTEILQTERDISFRYQAIGCFIFLGALFFMTLYIETRRLGKKT